MSKNSLRKDKTCLNCNYVVENRFCPNCGQENIDTRKSFYHLFIHFFEDLTHYENAFWRTIKNLIFKPASLTKEYLLGKRMSYLAPVRLYIFISFVTFFLLSVIPDSADTPEVKMGESKTEVAATGKKDTIYEEQQKIIDFEKQGLLSEKESDSIQKFILDSKKKQFDDEDDLFSSFGKYYKSVHELDSIQKAAKPSEKMNAFVFYMNRKMQMVQDKYTGKEIKEKFINSFASNFPKALFIYMPLFAFILWLFQNKKRWYYFDHGIFTLHYFSFLLLSVFFIRLINFVLSYFSDYTFFNVLEYVASAIVVIYMLYYFFPAHHRFYKEKRWVSLLKGIVMFIINFIAIIIILICFAFYTFINIH